MRRAISFPLFGDRRSLLRRFPETKARLRERFLRARTRVIPLSDDTLLCYVLGAFRLYLDGRDRSISPHILMDGLWEVRTTELMVDLLRFGMTAVDVGANLGYFTILMSTLTGPGGRVIAFEPNPRTAGLLRDSIMLNGLDGRVELHEAVVGESDGRPVHLLLSDAHPGGTQVTGLDPVGPGFLPAHTRRLDGFPGARDATLVKIDAEGMEEAVWQGMTGLIHGPKLRYIILEFTPESYRDPAGLLDEAEAAGFAVRHLHGERGLEPITRAEILDGTAQRMLFLERAAR